MLSVAFLYYNDKWHYAECHNAECHYAECHKAECHNAECHNAERHNAECRCAIIIPSLFVYEMKNYIANLI